MDAFMFEGGAATLKEPLASREGELPRIALIGGFSPRRCGIATFTTDTYASIKAAFPTAVIDVYAMAPLTNDIGFGAPVCGTIVENDPASFIAAATEIETSCADVIWLQHEFGLFGGRAGDKILELLDRVAAPLIVTLHTVMPDPDPDQLRVMLRIVAQASKLVVMSDRAALLLGSVFGADTNQIVLIPHGVPDRPFGRAEHFKRKFGLEGRQVLMTFGLLSPGKGIEVAVAALPEIAARHPNVIYCIVGATHPNLLATEGEAYRQRLQSLASELGVESHIQWVDEFLEADTLLNWIEAADIYLTPYLGANQATSGTLSYALALGKAIVSTPYAHAVELLADDHGVLVEFNNSPALAAAIDALLDNPDLLKALQVRAYNKGRDMIWPSFAARCLEVIDAVRVDSLDDASGVHIAAQALDGLLRICDDTGIIQHSIFSVPDRANGYCVDDNARALMLMNRMDCKETAQRERLTSIFAAFIESAWNEESGEFRNFMGYRRNWLEAAGSEDSCGRTLWALGATTLEGRNPQLRRWARKLYDRSSPSACNFQSLRALAFAMLGTDYVLASDQDVDGARNMLAKSGTFIHSRLLETRRKDWPWFESVLAYDNCRLPEAMLRAGLRLERPEFIQCGLETLGWIMSLQTSPSGCFRPIGSDSFGNEYALPRPFDQQPVEAWAAIDGARAAFDATHDPVWLDHAKRAYAWFSGANDRGVAVADLLTGSCNDGINPRGLNFNEGAESVLAFHLASCSIKDFEAKT
ncbi:glycosyltransferase family 4 protein [Aquisediminimonas profunda]|uniref:glycosyltransferase family 4 protein n=1 Tax=Aquisediminimonas profunda TaxID=1550733 RepID=UPI001FE579D1|nr:glycosyltransferase family 4 protein [Aquisediminimonas profunda]